MKTALGEIRTEEKMRRRHSYRRVFFYALVTFLCLSSFAEASIILRSVVVNTAAIQKRTVPFRAYLPREIKPEHVMDMGDLEIAFDPKEGVYYVFKDFLLEPRETVQVEVELEDVWKIPAVEITTLREEAVKAAKILARTDYHERASYLKNSIESKLNQVEQTQKAANPNPGGYISDYRESLKVLESVRQDLTAARDLMAQAKTIAPMVTWKLVIAVVIFLGVLGLVFFFIWQRQIKTLAELSEDYAGPVGPYDASRPPLRREEAERREVKEEKRPGLSDLEDRLKEKP